jgi:hypothetical protein
VEEVVKNGEIWNEIVEEGEGGGKCNTRNVVRGVGVVVMTPMVCREEGNLYTPPRRLLW